MTVLRDIEYVPGGHERQKLDLYLPKSPRATESAAAQRPLIVWVHGGAWLAGSKDRCRAVRFVREGGSIRTSAVAARNSVAAGCAGAESLRQGGVPVDIPPVARDVATYFEQWVAGE